MCNNCFEMILFTQDLPSLEPYIPETLSLYSRCGIGDLLILRDYVVPHPHTFGLEKCEHCGNFKGIGDAPIFRNNKKFLHIRLLRLPLESRTEKMPNYLHDFLIPFLEKIFPKNCTIFLTLAQNSNRATNGAWGENDIYYEGFADTPNFLSQEVFPILPHQDLSPEIFDSINIAHETAEILQTEYICIHTRYRSEIPADEDFFRSLLFDIIGATGKKICLIGEKSNSLQFSSVYDLCKRIVGPETLIDLTSEGLSVKNLATDALIAKHAKLCLAFGIGGNIVLNSYTKAPVHTFVDLGSDHPFFNEKSPITIYDNKYSFLLKISQIINLL